MLTNPIYIGKIKHKDKLYNGQHQAIITQDIWDKAQAMIKQQDTIHSLTKQKSQFFALKGLIKTKDDFALSPATFKQIRYYTSQKAIKYGYRQCNIKSINAQRLEQIILVYTLDNLPINIKQHLIKEYQSNTIDCWLILRKLIKQITLTTTNLWITLNKDNIQKLNHQLEQQDFNEPSKQVTSNNEQNITDKLKPIYPVKQYEVKDSLTIKLEINIKRMMVSVTFSLKKANHSS